MTTNFIDIDSSFRNRQLNSNPGSFQIQISNASSSTGIADPVCSSAPIISWTSSRFLPGSIQNFVTGTVSESKSSSLILYILGNFQRMTNYYRGAVLQLPGKINRKIVSYYFINSGFGRFELDQPIDNFSTGTNVTIFDSTNFDNPEAIELFVPGAIQLNDFYTYLLLFNENHGEYRIITRYFAESATVETNSPSNPVLTWSIYDNYSIRAAVPSLISTVGPSLTNKVNLIDGNQLPASAFKLCFLRELQNLYGNEQSVNAGLFSQVVAWDPLNLIATVTPPFRSAPTGKCEILPISSDNANPFTNIYSQIQQGTQIYLSLIHVSIPLAPLATKFGGSIRDYPYVYINLSNISNTMPKFCLVSNNPNAVNAQFRASLAPNENSQTFAKFTGDGTVQQLQLNPGESLFLSVILPDGSIFKTIENDTISPQSPNPLLQIAAYFSFRQNVVVKNPKDIEYHDMV